MWAAFRIGRCTFQAPPSKLPLRVTFLFLGAMMAVSLSLHVAYSYLLAPLNRQSSMTYIADHIHKSGFQLGGDEIDYYHIALNLMSGRGYSRSEVDKPPEPTAYRPPLFPAVLSVVFRIFGPSPQYGVWVNQALMILLIPLTFWLGSFLYGNRCGIAAATIVTLWPHGYYFGSDLLTEPLSAVFITITVGLIVRIVSFPSLRLAVAAGLAAGGAVLTRSNFAVIVAVLGFWFLFLPKQQNPLRTLFVFWSAVAIVLLPWAFRNYSVMNTFNPGTTGSGIVFAGAHNPQALAEYPGGWISPQPLMPDIYRVAQMPETERDAYFWRMGFDFLTQQSPLTLFRLFVLKLFRLWIPGQRIVNDGVCFLCNVITSLLFSVPFFFSILGLYLLSSQKPLFHLVILLLAGTTLVSILFWGSTRFRMPIEPILWVLAAFAMIRLIELRKPYKKPQ